MQSQHIEIISMAQRLKAHTHVNFNNSQHEQMIPEEGAIVYSNTYIPSSSASCSSLDGEDHNSDHDEGRFQYPQELLGMSWGSYLHSGPPTRVQTSTKAKGAAAMFNDPSPKHNAVTDSQFTKIAANQRNTEVHGILRTLQVPVNDDETTAQAVKRTQHPAKTVKLVCEVDDSEQNNSQLYQKFQALIKSLIDCNAELERYGLETIPMESPSSLLSRLERARKPEELEDNKSSVIASFSDRLIHDIIEYLGEMAKRLAKQGRKLNEQALFLQRTGKQLGRNQQSFMEEQTLLAQAAETAQEQLLIEKVMLGNVARKAKFKSTSKQYFYSKSWKNKSSTFGRLVSSYNHY